MNKSDLDKMQKCQEEYEKYLKESPLHSEIEKIARDIRDRQDNVMAMEFTRTIAELLRENGIVVHCEQYEDTQEFSGKSIEVKYGVRFDSVDCTKHDRQFTDKIAELEKELSVKENLLKTKDGLCGEEIPKEVTVDGFKCKITQTAQGLYIDRDRIYEIIDGETEPLKKELERKQTEINQIDEILNELFGVTHDIVKTPNEFEKILKENADNYKSISDIMPKEPIKMAELIIENFKQGIYPIYERDFSGNIKYTDVNGEKYAVETGMYRKYEEVRQIAEHLLVYCNHNLES